MTSLIVNEPTKITKAKTTVTKNKVPTLKYFFGEESGYNITVMDNLTATGKVTKERLAEVLKRDDLLLAQCKGDSLVISTIASNGLIRNIGYFNANKTRELFDEDADAGYKVIKENLDNLILAVSDDDFVDEWAA